VSDRGFIVPLRDYDDCDEPMAPGAEPLDVERLRIEASLRERRHAAELLRDEASYTLRGDPDATDEERERAKVDEACAFSGLAECDAKQFEIERAAERLTSTPLPATARAMRFRLLRPGARPRERRPGRRRRAVARAGPDSDSSDSDGEHPPVARRRRKSAA